MQRISVCMATKDEENAVGKIIEDFKKVLGRGIEVVITDSSEDSTPKIAKKLGAKVISQPPMGYGKALREALLSANGDIIVTTDCDGTYPVEAAPKMIELIREGYDEVSASRFFGKGRIKTMPLLNEVGNRVFAFLLSIFYKTGCTDATTGMRAFRREVIQNIEWTENIGLSLELFFKPAVLGYKIIEIPIDYRDRIGKVKLNPIKGGWEMIKTLIRYRIKPIQRIG